MGFKPRDEMDMAMLDGMGGVGDEFDLGADMDDADMAAADGMTLDGLDGAFEEVDDLKERY